MSFVKDSRLVEADGAHTDDAYTGNGSEVTGPRKKQIKKTTSRRDGKPFGACCRSTQTVIGDCFTMGKHEEIDYHTRISALVRVHQSSSFSIPWARY